MSFKLHTREHKDTWYKVWVNTWDEGGKLLSRVQLGGMPFDELQAFVEEMLRLEFGAKRLEIEEIRMSVYSVEEISA